MPVVSTKITRAERGRTRGSEDMARSTRLLPKLPRTHLPQLLMRHLRPSSKLYSIASDYDDDH
jgi:hypothetical protein